MASNAVSVGVLKFRARDENFEIPKEFVNLNGESERGSVTWHPQENETFARKLALDLLASFLIGSEKLIKERRYNSDAGHDVFVNSYTQTRGNPAPEILMISLAPSRSDRFGITNTIAQMQKHLNKLLKSYPNFPQSESSPLSRLFSLRLRKQIL